MTDTSTPTPTSTSVFVDMLRRSVQWHLFIGWSVAIYVFWRYPVHLIWNDILPLYGFSALPKPDDLTIGDWGVLASLPFIGFVSTKIGGQ